jgi:hypothetical protein
MNFSRNYRISITKFKSTHVIKPNYVKFKNNYITEYLLDYIKLQGNKTKFELQTVDVVSPDIWSRNGKSATMQDQSRGRT